MDKKKKKKKGSAVFLIVFLICLAVAAFSGYKLISIALDYKQGDDEYAALREYTAEGETDEDQDAGDGTQTDDAQTEKKKVEAPISVDIAGLKAVNPDFKAWLYIGGLDISYPVVQGADNDYYLHRTFEGTENFAGTLFMEYLNKDDFSDPNTIIYGHNMKNGSMFGKLKNINGQDGLTDDTFWLLTEEDNYEYKIFSIQTVTASSDVYTLFSGPGDIVSEYIEKRAAASSVALDPGEYDENSKIVTLSTCWGTGEDGSRFVVQGILISDNAPEGSEEDSADFALDGSTDTGTDVAAESTAQ